MRRAKNKAGNKSPTCPPVISQRPDARYETFCHSRGFAHIFSFALKFVYAHGPSKPSTQTTSSGVCNFFMQIGVDLICTISVASVCQFTFLGVFMEKYEKISQVCEHMGMSFVDAWPYLAGQQCRQVGIAEKMGQALGIKPETMLLGERRKRLRSGVLALFAAEVDTDRFHLCEILNGGRRPSLDLAQRLEAVSGVPADAWVSPEEHYNPILAYIQKQRRSLGGRRTRKPTRPIRLAPNRTATPAAAAGNDA